MTFPIAEMNPTIQVPTTDADGHRATSRGPGFCCADEIWPTVAAMSGNAAPKPVLRELDDDLPTFAHPDQLLSDSDRQLEQALLGSMARSRRNIEAESGNLRMG